MNSKSKDTFTGGEIIESDDVWIINSIDWNGTGFRYGIFFEKDLGVLTQKALLGFASGVMIAAGVRSLIMPSIEMAEEQGTIPWLPAAVGFLLGIAFLLALDTLIPHLHVNDEKPRGTGIELKEEHHAGACGYASQYSGRNGGRRCIRRCDDGKFYRIDGRSDCTCNWNCHSKFPGRRNHFDAIKITGNVKIKSLFVWRDVRCCGTDFGCDYDSVSRFSGACSAVLVIVCGGGNDLCGCGRIDSGIPGWRTFQYWNNWCCNRICNYDDFRCGTRIKTYKKGKNRE